MSRVPVWPSEPRPASVPGGARRLAFVSDTQGTSRWELGREDNRRARARLVQALVETRPDVVLHGGDLVTWGSSPRAWETFDALFEPLRRAGVPLWPVYGNHDRAPLRRRAERYMEARFPWLRGAGHPGEGGEGGDGYARRVGPLGVLLLDSNRVRLGRARWEAQRERLTAQLAAWEEDAAVLGVLAVWHHPPYTNSRLVRPSRAARDGLLEPLLAASKSLAALCGHAHAYERFHVGGRALFVAGGGGGPRQPLRDVRSRSFAPTRFGGGAGDASRSFLHFLTLELDAPAPPGASAPSGPRGLKVRVHRLLDPAARCDVAEEVWLPFERREPLPAAPAAPEPTGGSGARAQNKYDAPSTP